MSMVSMAVGLRKAAKESLHSVAAEILQRLPALDRLLESARYRRALKERQEFGYSLDYDVSTAEEQKLWEALDALVEGYDLKGPAKKDLLNITPGKDWRRIVADEKSTPDITSR